MNWNVTGVFTVVGGAVFLALGDCVLLFFIFTPQKALPGAVEGEARERSDAWEGQLVFECLAAFNLRKAHPGRDARWKD
jgi:hypothetical protein